MNSTSFAMLREMLRAIASNPESRITRAMDFVVLGVMMAAFCVQFRPRISRCAIVFVCVPSFALWFAVQIVSELFFGRVVALYILLLILWNFMELMLFFDGGWQRKLLYAVVYGTLWMQSIQIAISTVTLFLPGLHMRVLALPLFVLLTVFHVCNAPSSSHRMPGGYTCAMLAVYLINMSICLSEPVLFIPRQQVMLLFLYGGGSIIVELIVVWLIHQMMVKNDESRLLLAHHQQRAAESAIAGESLRQLEANRALQHEFNHYIGLIETLLEQNDSEQAKRLLNELHVRGEERRDASDCGNAIAEALLRRYEAQARNMGVPFEIDAHMSEDIPISALDLSSLLSNMLSNALEASTECANPYVKVEIRPVKRYLMIRVRNAVYRDVLRENPNLTTTKTDTEVHGVGVRIMRAIAEKYHGMLHFSVEDGMFIAEALLLCEEMP